METQAERQEKHMKQLAEVHRQKVALLESQFLQQKQQLLRGKAVSSTMVIKVGMVDPPLTKHFVTIELQFSSYSIPKKSSVMYTEYAKQSNKLKHILRNLE